MHKNAMIMSIPLVGLDRESMESHVIHGLLSFFVGSRKINLRNVL